MRQFSRARAGDLGRLPASVRSKPESAHLLLWPRRDGELGAYMMWLTTAHVRRYHQHYHSSGHVWQGRFRSFPIQEDAHLLTVHRYIERNPVRAGLVKRAQDWRWSSAAPVREEFPVLTPGPVPHLLDWLGYVNQPQTEAEVESLRDCIRRRRPYGNELWASQRANQIFKDIRCNAMHTPRVLA